MNKVTDFKKFLEDETLDTALNASSAMMKILIEAFSIHDAGETFCRDADSKRLLMLLNENIQRNFGRTVSCIPTAQKNTLVKYLDSAITQITRKASGFNSSRAQKRLLLLRRVKVDLA